MDKYRYEISDLFLNANVVSNVFPIPLEKIAKSLNYNVLDFEVNEKNKEISGAVIYDDSQILLNPNDTKHRRYFTLAHEIGHVVLNHGKDGGRVVDWRNNISDPIPNSDEWFANQFAAELLMPSDICEEKWKETKTLQKVADYFNVSVGVALVRLNALKLY